MSDCGGFSRQVPLGRNLCITVIVMLCKYPQTFKRVSEDAAFGCGVCTNCRINKQRVWQHRMLLQAECHDYSSFLTLTYDDDNLPREFFDADTGVVYADNSVNPDHHRLFINNYRTQAARKLGVTNIKFFCAAEYGDMSERPHFHYCIFGMPPCPYVGARSSQRFKQCYCDICRFTHDVWQKGNILSGTFTEHSAAYSAKYVTKRLTNASDFRQDGYNGLTNFQKLAGRHPEFARQSRKPGLGRDMIPEVARQLTSVGILDHDRIPTVLLVGSKPMPLGRYLSDALYDELGLQFADGERLRRYEAYLRSLLITSSYPSESSKEMALKSRSIASSLSLLNSQRVLNFEARLRMFSSVGSI